MDGDARLNKARRAYFNMTWWSSTPDWNLECLFALFVLFRLLDCCSQILILDARIFDIYHSVAMRVRDAWDQDCFNNVRTFHMLRKVKRSRAESQTSHSFAGANDRWCNLIYMKPCHQAMMMWACGNPSMRCESRVRPGMWHYREWRWAEWRCATSLAPVISSSIVAHRCLQILSHAGRTAKPGSLWQFAST